MGRPKKRNRPNQTGRNPTGRFVRLGYNLLTTNAYRSLSPNARSLLVELTMLYNADNNGSLYLSVRDAAYRLGVADLTAASRAFDDLLELGFIQMTKKAHFFVKAGEASRARCWRLTWLPGPGRKIATWDFLEREPEPQTPERKRMERGLRALAAYRKARSRGNFPILDCGTQPHIGPEKAIEPVANSDTLNHRNGGILTIFHIPDFGTHLAIPWGWERRRALVGWWQADCTPQVARLFYARTLATHLFAASQSRGTKAA